MKEFDPLGELNQTFIPNIDEFGACALKDPAAETDHLTSKGKRKSKKRKDEGGGGGWRLFNLNISTANKNGSERTKERDQRQEDYRDGNA